MILVIRKRSYPAAPATGANLTSFFEAADTMSFAMQMASRDAAVIRIGKALDFRNAATFKDACQTQIRAGARHFILDFSGTGILDSTGLGTIFSLYRQLSPLGGKLVFADVSRPVQVVVQLTRTYKVFRQYPTVEDAFRYVSSDSGGYPAAGTSTVEPA
jgi:anti-sigma B factor antagonist